MFYLGLWSSKLYLAILKLLKKERDDKPGFIAYRFCKDFLKKLNKPKIVIGITGTNGKTTTINLVADSLKKLGYKVIYNDWGANTLGGTARCLIEGVNIFNKPKNVVALIEVDEVTADETVPMLNLSYLICTNLFRDSMHRNAHPDYIYNKIDNGIQKYTTLILNADDPFSSRLKEKDNKCIYYSIDKLDTDVDKCVNIINDFQICPNCYSNLVYDYVRYHHLGKVHCPNCDFKNKTPNYLAKLDTNNKLINLSMNNNDITLKMINDSIFNCYNEIAVAALLDDMGIEKEKIVSTINSLEITKTRYTSTTINNITINTMVAKGMNAIATSRALDYVHNFNGNVELVLVLDDQFDNKNGSEAIAWIYDTDFEFLNHDNIKKIVIGGVRSRDYKLRLLFAGVPEERIVICDNELDTPKYVDTNNIDTIVILHDVYYITGGQTIKNKIIEKIKSGSDK